MYEEDKENIRTAIKKTPGLATLRTVPKSILQEYKVFPSTALTNDIPNAGQEKGCRGSASQEDNKKNSAGNKNNEKAGNCNVRKEDVKGVMNMHGYKQIDKSNEKALKLKGLRKKDGDKKVPVVSKKFSSVVSRRSVFSTEPDLNRNKPSRIIEKKKVSFAISSKLEPSKFVTQTARLLNNVMENTPKPEIVIQATEPMEKKAEPIRMPVKRLSTIKQATVPITERSSRKPRPSGVLKTIFNSPPNTRHTVRKTLTPPFSKKNEENLPSIFGKNKIPLRHSRILTKAENKANIQDKKDQKNAQTKQATPIYRQNFLCEKCQRKFRLLSSLESHKKTHETALVSALMCKYCDKKFAISKALEIHLLEKCSRIPTAERRKLLPIPAPDTKSMPRPLSPSKIRKKMQIPHSGVFRIQSKPVICYPCKKSFNSIPNFIEHVLNHGSSGPDS